MNNDNTLKPKYRFPEFKNDGNWEKYRIGDYMQPYTGLTGKSGNDFGSGKPYISYKQVFDGAHIKIEDCPLVKIDKNENQNKVEYGDVLITTSSETANEVGYTNVITTKLNDETYLNSFCFGLRPMDLNFPSVLFSKYLFKNNEYRNAVVLLAQGVTRYNISKTKVVELKLSMPSNPAEQQKIAACLSSLDDLIAGHEEKLTLLEEHKKGLMQNLFPQEGETQPKYRFPEFENDGDWVEKTIANITTKVSDGIHTTPIYSDDGKYYFINGNNLIDNKIVFDINTKRVSENEYLKHKKDLGSGTILLSINGTIGNIAFYSDEKVLLGKSACYINCDESKVLKIFLANQIKTNRVLTFFNSQLTGAVIKNLSLKTIKETIIYLPANIEEQQKIATVLSSVDELIVAQREKIETLKEHKKGLMQGLFPKIES